MKCDLIFCERKIAPIFECGGVHLSPGDELIVKSEWSKRILDTNSGLKVVRSLEMSSLQNGHYQVDSKASKRTQQNASPGDSPVKQVSQDKSLENKSNVKGK